MNLEPAIQKAVDGSDERANAKAEQHGRYGEGGLMLTAKSKRYG